MPKKQPRNSFYFFMVNFKEEQRKKGIVYANMTEVSQAAGPAWSSAPPAVRAKFEAIAKAEKAKNNVPERKYTSTGVCLADLEAAERERAAAIEAENRDIVNFVKQKSVNGSIQDEDIFLMDINCFCKAAGSWLVGEFTLLRFTLKHGIKDSYHEVIHPGGIPLGYALDVKLGARELGLREPDETERRSDYVHILANVVDYLRRRDAAAAAPAAAPLPPLYTMPDKVEQCADFIQQLCTRAAQYDTPFRVYRLDTLLYQIVSHIPSRKDEGFPKESLALNLLKKDPFKYTPALACEMHEEADRCVECSNSRATRWAFTVLDKTCALLGQPALPGRHVPADYDVPAIVAHKEERLLAQEGGGAGAAHVPPDDTPATYSFDSSYSSTLDTSRNTNTSTEKKYVPVRMPQCDYSLSVRAAPALSSSHEDFPPLGGRVSKGRGRGLGSSFDRMKM